MRVDPWCVPFIAAIVALTVTAAFYALSSWATGRKGNRHAD